MKDMPTYPVPEPRTSSALAVLGKRIVAALLLVAVAIVALKLLVGFVVGLLTTVVMLVAIVALAVGAVWAYKRL